MNCLIFYGQMNLTCQSPKEKDFLGQIHRELIQMLQFNQSRKLSFWKTLGLSFYVCICLAFLHYNALELTAMAYNPAWNTDKRHTRAVDFLFLCLYAHQPRQWYPSMSHPCNRTYTPSDRICLLASLLSKEIHLHLYSIDLNQLLLTSWNPLMNPLFYNHHSQHLIPSLQLFFDEVKPSFLHLQSHIQFKDLNFIELLLS